jgi:hypothetical protein
VKPIGSWDLLNAELMRIEDEAECLPLLEAEKRRPEGGRGLFLMRIYSRYNKLRGRREREELKQYFTSPVRSKDPDYIRERRFEAPDEFP